MTNKKLPLPPSLLAENSREVQRRAGRASQGYVSRETVINWIVGRYSMMVQAEIAEGKLLEMSDNLAGLLIEAAVRFERLPPDQVEAYPDLLLLTVKQRPELLTKWRLRQAQVDEFVSSLTYQECICILDACQVWWLRRRAGHEVKATTFDLWRGLIAPYHALWKQETDNEQRTETT